MWLYSYLLGILASGSIHTLHIGYPYGILLDSARLASQAATPQGFLVFIDQTGTERLVTYNYAEPVYALRRINFITSAANEHLKFESFDSELDKAREAHFRAWSLQQYQVLKREIDFLRGEGKEPSIEMKLKFLPLEKIALTSDFAKIAELPEIKRIQEEHFNIWKKSVHKDEEQFKPNTKFSKQFLTSAVTENTVKGIRNEQLKDVSMGMNQRYSEGDSPKTSNIQSSSASNNKIFNKTITAPDEQIEARNNNYSSVVKDGRNNDNTNQKLETNEQFVAQLNTNSSNDIKTQEYIRNVIGKNGNLEICSTSAEYHNCSKVKGTSNVEQQAPVKDIDKNIKKIGNKQKVHSEIEKLIFGAPTIYVPQQVVDTDEVKRAREEHLKIVNDAIYKAKLAQSLKQTVESSTNLSEMEFKQTGES